MNQSPTNNIQYSKVTICRVYTPPAQKKGMWLLVDRLWPRGIKKEDLAIDLWLKEVAPSTSLRKWFNHEPAKWLEFTKLYMQELKDKDKQELIKSVLIKADHAPITLLYAAKGTQHNHAIVLQAILQSWPNLPVFDGS